MEIFSLLFFKFIPLNALIIFHNSNEKNCIGYPVPKSSIVSGHFKSVNLNYFSFKIFDGDSAPLYSIDNTNVGRFEITSLNGDHLKFCSFKLDKSMELIIEMEIDTSFSEKHVKLLSETNNNMSAILWEADYLYERALLIFDLFSQTKSREAFLLQTSGTFEALKN